MRRGNLEGGAATLNDLRKNEYLHARCGHCGHGGHVLPRDTTGRIPNTTRLVDLWKKLKCRKCGKTCCQTTITVRHR